MKAEFEDFQGGRRDGPLDFLVVAEKMAPQQWPSINPLAGAGHNRTLQPRTVIHCKSAGRIHYCAHVDFLILVNIGVYDGYHIGTCLAVIVMRTLERLCNLNKVRT